MTMPETTLLCWRDERAFETYSVDVLSHHRREDIVGDNRKMIGDGITYR